MLPELNLSKSAIGATEIPIDSRHWRAYWMNRLNEGTTTVEAKADFVALMDWIEEQTQEKQGWGIFG